MANNIPQLSLTRYRFGTDQEQSEFATELCSALKNYGFFILKDHDIEQAKIDRALNSMKEFFALPYEEKRRYEIPAAQGQRGYSGFGNNQSIKDNAPDPKEYWHLGREKFSGDPLVTNVWPDNLPEFRSALVGLFETVDEMSKSLMAALGRGLGRPEGYFEELTEDGNCVLRCLHYPRLDAAESFSGAPYRAAPHKDINFFTMLVGEVNSGLQFLDQNGEWLEVEAEPGAIVVDSGEMLSLVTNDLIPATTHRVVKPETQESSRYSMVFLVHPRPDAMLSGIESIGVGDENRRPVAAHEFLMNRIRYWTENSVQ
jgi:isopenicillin N synthase-like dioxygenase